MYNSVLAKTTNESRENKHDGKRDQVINSICKT